jgi:hypothetical protein
LTLFPSTIKNGTEVFLVSTGLGLGGKVSEGVLYSVILHSQRFYF